MSIQTIQAIDVHGHYGTFSNRIFTQAEAWLSAPADEVARRARQANIEATVVSPLRALMPRFQADAVAGNEEASRITAQTPGIYQWVVLHPGQKQTFDQAREAFKTTHCVGIKIHPEEHGYPIAEHGDEIFRFAAENHAVVLTHSGEENSWPRDFVPFANAYPEVQLILAHLGNGADDDKTHQVRAIGAAQHNNLWVDTSSASSILSGLIEWAVGEIGAERILFGTDTPLYSTAMQRIRIDSAEISDDDKRLILRDNALKLLPLNIT